MTQNNSHQLYFSKPFILVTRIEENNTNDSYLNPTQCYYEFDTMDVLFKYASRYLKHDEKALTALRIHTNDNGEDTSSYFVDFPTALNEYKIGVRSRVQDT